MRHHPWLLRAMLVGLLAGCGGGGTSGPPNTPPDAQASGATRVYIGTSITLDGNGSHDPDGDALTYEWSVAAAPPGSRATPSDPASVQSSFTPDVEGDFTLSLTVSDGKARSAPALVAVTGLPLPWSVVAAPPTPRERAAAAALGTDVYLIGGTTGSIVEVFDTVGGTWRSEAPVPTPRAGLVAAAVGGKVYAIGSNGSSGPLPTVEAFDPATGAWTTRAPMPSPRTDAAAAVIDGRIYVVGGRYADAFGVDTVESYDPATDTWRTHPSLPRARHSLGVAALNGLLYVVGGTERAGILITGPSMRVDRFDPATGIWTQASSLAEPRTAVAAAAVAGKVLAIGGTDRPAFGDTLAWFDPGASLWSTRLAYLPVKDHHGLAAAVVGAKVYVFYSDTGLVYDPAKDLF